MADGSGSEIAMAVLDSLYKKDTNINEGVKLAVKAISASIQRDTASGEGIDVFTVTKDGVKQVFTRKIDTTITV